MSAHFPAVYALAWGLWIAQLDVSGLVEKAGFAGLSVALVYWITARLSRQLDEQTQRMAEVCRALERLADAVRRHTEENG